MKNHNNWFKLLEKGKIIVANSGYVLVYDVNQDKVTSETNTKDLF